MDEYDKIMIKQFMALTNETQRNKSSYGMEKKVEYLANGNCIVFSLILDSINIQFQLTVIVNNIVLFNLIYFIECHHSS